MIQGNGLSTPSSSHHLTFSSSHFLILFLFFSVRSVFCAYLTLHVPSGHRYPFLFENCKRRDHSHFQSFKDYPDAPELYPITLLQAIKTIPLHKNYKINRTLFRLSNQAHNDFYNALPTCRWFILHLDRVSQML